MRVVGDVIGDRRRLRLEAGESGQGEALPLVVSGDRLGQAPCAPARKRLARSVEQGTIVLDQAFQLLEGQVRAVESGVTPLQFGHQAQAVAVMVEAAEWGLAGVERGLAGMAERRVAEVMTERDRLAKVLIEPKGLGQSAGDLRDFDRMGEAGAEMVAFMMDEHLRLMGKAAKGGGMDDAVAVALEGRARRRGCLVMQPPAGGRRIGAIGS